MSSQIEFQGPNAAYILELYERYQASPDAVDATTRQFFQQWSPSQIADAREAVDTVVIQPQPSQSVESVNLEKVFGAIRFARSIRRYGHLSAQLDPLGSLPPGDPALAPSAHRITYDDLRQLPAFLIGDPVAQHYTNAFDAIKKLEEIYSSSIGYDNDHVHSPEERQWLRRAFESRDYAFKGDAEAARQLLRQLTKIEAMELFLQRSFPTKYRFSIEGLDMMVPVLDEIIVASAETGIETIAIAMAHRGRLNVLAHIMDKPYEEILADFKDELQLQHELGGIGWTIGDVKYHKGETRQVQAADGSMITITMPPNPSHLEMVNPVAVGMARAAGTTVDHPGEPFFDNNRTLQILIHGDASFAGQGIVAETFNLSFLEGYYTGGTIHVIANNQLGFTTLPHEGRSTLYASDLAKGFQVPILHVNADDPAACIEVARIAFGYQATFEKDFMIDLIGYRRYGHNELDEPGFTQPLLYQTVRQHPTVRQIWAEQLKQGQFVTDADIDEIMDEANQKMEEAHQIKINAEDLEEAQLQKPEPGLAKRTETAISPETLHQLNDGLRKTYEGFNFYSIRFKKTITSRRDLPGDTSQTVIDWATAEELAFASILAEGIAIRLTGQDSGRGTFSHRHSVLHDAKSGEPLIPLQKFEQAKAAFEVHNSPLSEAAVLGFEFGYNVQASDRLVLWEAQYGDFQNGAQTIIDEFVVSAREKWAQTPSLVMLLPHGSEGAGPDHSSARPERYLQMAAKYNFRMVNCTTAAQYFHVLRRQALLLEKDPLPLIVLSPKSLLRNPFVASSIQELTAGKFQPVLDDMEVDPSIVNRLVICSGKFYLDLLNSEWREKYPDVGVCRLEQLYPFPAEEIQAVINRYPKLSQIVWAQEEPKNMGAYDFISYRLKKLVGLGLPVNYVGRRRSSSPAEGSKTAFAVNQSMIIEYAFNWQFEYDLRVKES